MAHYIYVKWLAVVVAGIFIRNSYVLYSICIADAGRWVMNTLDLFKDETDFKEFKAGETIFREGEPGDNLYVVMEGSVDIKVAGEKFIAAQPGDIVGEMALIDASARSATAVARTRCKLIAINEKRFTHLTQQTPYFAIYVMRVLVERLRRMNKILASIT